MIKYYELQKLAGTWQTDQIIFNKNEAREALEYNKKHLTGYKWRLVEKTGKEQTS